MIFNLDNGLSAIIDKSGVTRVLAKLAPDLKKRSTCPNIFSKVQDIPKSDWFPTKRRNYFTSKFVLDQKSHGSCCGYGSTGGFMKARAMKGMTFQLLSGSYTYSWINGNQDNGAIIHDSLDSLIQHGTCLDSEANYNQIYRSQIPASADQTAVRFKVMKSYTADTWAQWMSGLMMGYMGVFAVMVGNTFMNLDQDGIVGFDQGPGNHCVHAFDVEQSSKGDWITRGGNSWGTTFGQAGQFCVTERHWESVAQDAYLIEVAEEDPQEPEPKV